MRRGNNQNHHRGFSKLVAIQVDDIDDSLEWFGNYTEEGETPIILIPNRSSCMPYIYVPEGTFGVITSHGKFDHIQDEGGLHWCMPWTKIQFLVSKQDIVYRFPVRACPTYDNIFVALDIAVVFCVSKFPMDKQRTHEAVKNFCYKISINQLNEQLEAAITERVRVLIRSKTHLEVNQIKGSANTAGMKQFLNEMFQEKGLTFKDIIITEVQLPPEIQGPLDLKAQFASLNDKEREQYSYDMRIIDDDEELQAFKQSKYEQRDSFKEDFSKQITLTERELEIIRANAKKSVSEINYQAKAEEAHVRAEAELKEQQINGETLVTKSKDETNGLMTAELIEVRAKNECNMKIAAKMAELADIKAKTIDTVSNGEGQIGKVMASRRKYEHLDAKIKVIEGFKNNGNVKIFGDNNDDVLAQMAAYRITADKKAL